jgi:hypothetical protein
MTMVLRQYRTDSRAENRLIANIVHLPYVLNMCKCPDLIDRNDQLLIDHRQLYGHCLAMNSIEITMRMIFQANLSIYFLLNHLDTRIDVLL